VDHRPSHAIPGSPREPQARTSCAMITPRQCASLVLRRPGLFAARVLVAFHRNHGILLAGAVAYYLLLSIIPLFALMLIVLSYFTEEATLVYVMGTYLQLVLPGSAEALTEQVQSFLANRHVVGLVGVLVLLFFSSLAFTALEKAMCVIFFHRMELPRRHFLVSALIPYVFILVLGVGVLLVSLITSALSALELRELSLLGQTVSLHGSTRVVLYLLGVLGLILMLTALYLVMPVGRIAFRHALYGGITAGLLWEVTSHVLVWYFTTLSLVDVVYGALATAIVTLISFEVAAIILLLGAQVIAEFERSVAEACARRREEG
jgi:membrane protein